MTDEKIRALVEHRLEKSEEALRAGKSMFDQGMLIFAMNRIYLYSLCRTNRFPSMVRSKDFLTGNM